MISFEIVDTFPAFLSYWAGARHESVDDQIALWANQYMSGWGELLDKQTGDYSEQNLDWKEIARQRIFPCLKDRLPAMRKARKNLLRLCPPIVAETERILGFSVDPYLVIYVGIGCGAGWATTFRGRYSILFGLESIAECGWSDPESIMGLVSHEMGHVVHYHVREVNNKKSGSNAWWQLYTEGFAQYYETLLSASAHQETQDSDWQEWCRQNRSRLASDFMRSVTEGEPVNAFFGSWFEIDGHSETGYFLGHEVVKILAQTMSFDDIALLDDFEERAREILEEMKLGLLSHAA